MATSQNFRVGKVTVYLRGQVWYLRYHENGKLHQVRASDDKKAHGKISFDESVLNSKKMEFRQEHHQLKP